MALRCKLQVSVFFVQILLLQTKNAVRALCELSAVQSAAYSEIQSMERYFALLSL
jgi:hypothetical protein